MDQLELWYCEFSICFLSQVKVERKSDFPLPALRKSVYQTSGCNVNI